jgi:hypothetical protein
MDNREDQAAPEKPPEAPETPRTIIHPTCPGCGADPLILKRLRHDFPDGVIVEVLFCANLECRIAIGAQIVGIERAKR